jgi:hypothetical protein
MASDMPSTVAMAVWMVGAAVDVTAVGAGGVAVAVEEAAAVGVDADPPVMTATVTPTTAAADRPMIAMRVRVLFMTSHFWVG